MSLPKGTVLKLKANTTIVGGKPVHHLLPGSGVVVLRSVNLLRGFDTYLVEGYSRHTLDAIEQLISTEDIETHCN